MTRLSHALTAAVAMVMGLWVTASPAAGPALSDEVRKDFEWFAKLGYPDVSQARWADIFNGWHNIPQGKPPTQIPRHGLVLTEDEKTFTVLDLNLTQATHTRTGPEVPPHQRVAWQARSLEADARELLDQGRKSLLNLENSSGRLRSPPIETFFDRLSRKSVTFFMAFVCHRQGLDDLAADLVALARMLPDRQGKVQEDLRLTLEREFGHLAMWQAVENMGGISNGSLWVFANEDSLIPRKEMLEHFRRVVELCPRCEHIPRAKETIALLERMVAEDEAHASLTDEALAKLPVEEQVREWVFRLRDQNGHQCSQPGGCDIFDDMGGWGGGANGGKSPAHQLVRIGFAAVPQLIEALADERFSRSVEFHRNFHFSHRIFTVGDCAWDILARIAGRHFADPRRGGDEPAKEAAASRRRVIETWWNEFRIKGEKQTLVDAVASGKEHPFKMAERLDQKYPEALTDALLLGAERATEEWIREAYLHHMGSQKDERLTAYLLKKLRSDAEPGQRLAAAQALLKQDHPEAMPAVLEIWHALPSKAVIDKREFQAAADFLVRTPSEVAMRSLAAKWKEGDTAVRFDLVYRLARAEWINDAGLPNASPELKAATRAAEEWLVGALEDTQPCDGRSGSWGEYVFANPRVSEMALFTLHMRFPKRYAFSMQAGRDERERERIIAMNQWRKGEKLPALPVPPPKHPPLPREQALQIVKVRVVEGLDLPDAARQELERLKGADLIPEVFVSLPARFAGDDWPGVIALTVEAWRDADLTGVTLALRPEQDGASGLWQWSTNGRIGAVTLSSRSGDTSAAGARDKTVWKEFLEELRTSFAESSANTPFEVRMTLRKPKP